MAAMNRMALAAAIALSPGCPAPEAEADQEPTSEAGTAASEDAPGSESTTSAPAARVPAKGIDIDWVEVNQGIGIKVGEDGEWVGAEGRTAFLLANRNALVRAFWEIDDDFEPREIVAELHLTAADGTTEILSNTANVMGPSFIGDLSESFFWGVEAAKAQPGLRYHVELWEVDGTVDDGSYPAAPPRLPADDSDPLVGIEDSYQVMKIVIVPFNYDFGGCTTSPDTSEETMQRYYDLIFMMNPVDRVDIEMHEPIDWQGELEGFSQLNSLMSDLRFEEGAPPETYYYGLVNVCAGGLGGAGGQAFGIPVDPVVDNAFQRVSSGLSTGDVEWSAETFVHEVGHSQGRRHVACNGEEGGPDPSYPIEGGDVGEWGFGIIDFLLRHPTVHKDYMTYCHPTWVSTWGWNKVFPTIQALSQWDEAKPGSADRPPYGGSILVGIVLPSGKEIWQTVPGAIPEAELSNSMTFEFADSAGVVTTRRAKVRELPDAKGEQMIVVSIPDRFDTVEHVTRIVDKERHSIARTAIREHHLARHVVARPPQSD